MLTDQKNSVEEFREQLNYTSDGARKRRGRGREIAAKERNARKRGGSKKREKKDERLGPTA